MKTPLICFLISLISILEANAQTVTDIDGNVYHTVTIGTQVWMKENLSVTHYNDGVIIPNITNVAAWSNLTTGAWNYYDNDSSIGSIYGKLYNWYTIEEVRDVNICPLGWHVPSDTDWLTLVYFLGGSSLAGGALKESGLAHWHSPNTGATNSSGFTALPAGNFGSFGSFGLTDGAYFWSTRENNDSTAIIWTMSSASQGAIAGSFLKTTGISVRCVSDYPASINETNQNLLLKIHPSPTNGKISLQLPPQFEKAKTLEIFDHTGSLLLSMDYSIEVDVTSLAGGLYYLVVTNAEGERVSGKFVKKLN